MADTLDLVILDSGSPAYAIAFARCGSDVAVERIACDKELKALADFRDDIDRAVRGAARKPPPAKLEEYGHNLFKFLFTGDVEKLYVRLPNSHVRINILSNRSDLQSLPWEYLQEPGRSPGPRLDRSVVRVVKTIGIEPLGPLSLAEKVRLLYAYADPIDQQSVPWEDTMATIKRDLEARIPDNFELDVVEGATRDKLSDALLKGNFEIFHFCGHGIVSKEGVGNLVLNDKNDKSSYMEADELAGLLRGGVNLRLVVLSACKTSAGNFADNFSVLAETLVREGIPAVVANQLHFPTKTVAAFVGPMYDSLLQSGDIDQAVNRGRVKIWSAFSASQDAPLEWGIPTLYRHIAGSKVFNP